MMRQHQIQKSPSLPWCIVFHFSVGDRERDKALRLQEHNIGQDAGLQSTVGKNCINVIRIQTFTIQDSSDIYGEKIGWEAELRSFQEEV